MRLPGRKKSNGDSKAALEDAQRNVEKAKQQNPEVYSVAGQSRRIREANHFAEEIHILMYGHPPKREAQ